MKSVKCSNDYRQMIDFFSEIPIRFRLVFCVSVFLNLFLSNLPFLPLPFAALLRRFVELELANKCLDLTNAQIVFQLYVFTRELEQQK